MMPEELKDILNIAQFSKDAIVKQLNTNIDNFNEAIRLSIEGEHPISWRATWVLRHASSKNDLRLTPYISRYINLLSNCSEGQQREILNILIKMKLDEDQEGHLFDHCMSLWESVNLIPSVRAKAFDFILKTVKKHPELKSEITFLTQDHYLENLSPGIKKSIEKRIALVF